MELITQDGCISKLFALTSLTHRVLCSRFALLGTKSKDIKVILKSQSDMQAHLVVGCISADRVGEADVCTASYTPRERDTSKGKIIAVVQSLIDSGIDIKVYLD
ncbi:hypothetical protein NL676_030715 [Syzygium grande]|nr:hypothetical protein NL676_030715 [Syzygium grande]